MAGNPADVTVPADALGRLRMGMREWGGDVAIIVAVSLVGAVVFFLPFWLHVGQFLAIDFEGLGVEAVQRHWDGPHYAIIAKTFYQPDDIYTWFWRPASYYSSHLLGYPVIVRLFSPLFGYLNGMLVANVVLSTLTSLALYMFVRQYGQDKRNALWVALAFLFLPPRWLLYRYSGASEPLFVLEVILMAYLFRQERYVLTGWVGAAAVLTRVQGLTLLPVFGLLLFYPRRNEEGRLYIPWRNISNALPLIAIPIAFGWVYLLYEVTYGDGLMNFHAGFYTQSAWPPYGALALYNVWSEGSIYGWGVVMLGSYWLYQKGHFDLALISMALTLPTFLFVHHDITRYLIPAYPFAVFFAGEKIIASKGFRLAALVLLPGVFIYTWGAMLGNLAPAANFTKLQEFF